MLKNYQMSAFVYLQLFSKKKAGEFFAKVTQTELWKNIQIRIHVFVNKEACQLEKWEFTDVFWVKTEEKVLATQNPHCHFIGMVT